MKKIEGVQRIKIETRMNEERKSQTWRVKRNA